MRYLGLDIGRRYIGVAVGEVIASELTTLICPKKEEFYKEPHRSFACQELMRLLQREEADSFVAGLPVDQQGRETEESVKIRQFCKHLSESSNTAVHFVNETLTSFLAAEILEGQDVDREEAKERVHQVSAQLILQQYFEENESL